LAYPFGSRRRQGPLLAVLALAGAACFGGSRSEVPFPMPSPSGARGSAAGLEVERDSAPASSGKASAALKAAAPRGKAPAAKPAAPKAPAAKATAPTTSAPKTPAGKTSKEAPKRPSSGTVVEGPATSAPDRSSAARMLPRVRVDSTAL